MALAKLRDERLRGLHLADRDRMNPDRRAGDGRPEAEAFAQAPAVGGIAQAPPELHQDGEGRGKVDQYVVEVVHRASRIVREAQEREADLPVARVAADLGEAAREAVQHALAP